MIQYTYYGHSCFEIIINKKKILFDPFITNNEKAKHIDIEKIQPDYIFVSHAHYDHTADLIAIAKQSKAKVVASFEICQWLQQNGVDQLEMMNVGGTIHFESGKVKAVIALHSSSFANGMYGGQPMGFVFQLPEVNFYYSGDTGLTLDMQLILKFTTLDFAIFPIGDRFTMNYKDALEAATLVKTNKVIGVHFDTWEFIAINHQEAMDSFAQQGKKLYLPKIGEQLSF